MIQTKDEQEWWRVGSKVPLNVYVGDRAVCQCHTAKDAMLIVNHMNCIADIRRIAETKDVPEWAQPLPWAVVKFCRTCVRRLEGK